MINAKEAREKSVAKLNEIIEEQKQEVEKLILEACEEGEFFIIYPRRIADEVLKWLDDLGYNIEEDEEDEFIIEWEFLEEAATNKDEEVTNQEDEIESVEEEFETEIADENMAAVEAEENGESEEVFFDEDLEKEEASEEVAEEKTDESSEVESAEEVKEEGSVTEGNTGTSIFG